MTNSWNPHSQTFYCKTKILNLGSNLIKESIQLLVSTGWCHLSNNYEVLATERTVHDGYLQIPLLAEVCSRLGKLAC